MKFFLIILKNLRRNLLRTTLTCLAVMALVFVVSMIWTVVYFLDNLTNENSENPKAIVSERWQVPSLMPLSYEPDLSRGAAKEGTNDVKPRESMSWLFYVATLDPAKKTRDNLLFFIATDPRKLPRMLQDYKDLDPSIAEAAYQKKDGAVLGRKRLQAINKRVGERFKVTGLNFSGIDLEFEIIGTLPPGRADDSAVMNARYLNDSIDAYNRTKAVPHPLDRRRLSLVWLEVADQEEFGRLAAQIESSSVFKDPAVKCESLAAAVASAAEVYSGLFWFVKWWLVPLCMVSMTMIIANAISIGVRERRTELAVLKVLGFRPGQILILVLAEALLVGMCSGFLSAALTYGICNYGMGGLVLAPNSPAFPVPINVLWWATGIGAFTALLGSMVPAWSARTVKVSEVFAKIA